jgi:Flp pilus assembly protein TadG
MKKQLKARRRDHSWRQRSGAAVVEMAICLPLLFTVVLGIVEFGRGMMVSELVNNSAREGARLAIVAGTTNNDVTQAVKDFLQAAGINSQDVTVTITVTAATGNPNPNNQVGNATTRDVCTVQVQVPFNKVSFIPGSYLNGKNLKGLCAMRHE